MKSNSYSQLDRLVQEVLAFERAYVTNPTCSPSRLSIITGKYPSLYWCWNIGVALDKAQKSVGDILAENGYQTGRSSYLTNC